MKIAAILTGKKNSTLKNKNIIKILDKYIFTYPCIEAKKIKSISYFYSSSDSEKILKTTRKYGFKSIVRPKKLAAKNSKHIDVIKHAIKKMSIDKCFPEIIVILMANAPIIKAKWIKECINILKKNPNITAIVPVKKNNDNHPERAKKINNSFLNNFINKKNISSNRQDLENCYFLCHNFWVIKTNEIFKNDGLPPWSFMGKKVKPYIIKNSVDIHNTIDIEIAKILIKKKNIYL